MEVVDESVPTKNPPGKFIGIGQKKIIVSLYKDLLKKQHENPDRPRLNFKQTIIEISKSSGIGQRTIQATLSEYKNHGTFSSPNTTKNRPTILHKID